MAEIIRIYSPNEEKIFEDCIFNYSIEILHILKEKGGKTFTFFAIDTSTNKEIIEYCDDNSKWMDVFYIFKNKVLEKKEIWGKDKYIEFIFYSRQIFEIENFEDVKPDPCLENNRYVWLTGNITNLDEIEKALGKKFTVPSQAVAYYDELLDKNIIIKGIFTALIYDLKLKKSYWLQNGLPKWRLTRLQPSSSSPDSDDYGEYFVTIDGTTENIKILLYPKVYSDIRTNDSYPYYLNDYSIKGIMGVPSEKFKHYYYLLSSGGVNSIMNSYIFIKDYITDVNGDFFTNEIEERPDINKMKFILTYFDYGSKTSKQEIAAMKNFYEFLKMEFPEFDFEYRIIDVKDFFNEFSRIINKNLNNYFPFKNTEISILLSNMIDKDLEKELFFPYIIFGSELSKSFYHLENNHAWFQAIKNIIMYGSENYKKVKFITPLKNLSRGNIYLYFLNKYGYDKTKELLDIAYSCVDPDENGKPCGKCNNCILLEKTFKETIKYIKKIFFKNKLKGE